MRINVASVYVDDQDNALRFYTEVLGFEKKTEMVVDDFRWLTVVSPLEPEGPELILEPDAHPAAKQFKSAMRNDGIPFTSFAVENVAAEHERLTTLGVEFTQTPTNVGSAITAVFDDTCGNLIQISQPV